MERRSARKAHAVASFLFLFSSCTGFTPPPPVSPVAGEEKPDLLQRASGFLVTADRSESGGLSAVRVVALPDLTERKIQPTVSGDVRFVHALAGPDRAGRIAVIQQGMADPNRVIVIQVDGSGEREITRVPLKTAGGKHEWLDPGIGEHIAISPLRGRVAFIRDLLSRQMPRVLSEVGSLEVWDIEAVQRVCTQPGVVDWGISWFPDGRRVAYVAFLPREQVPLPGADDGFGKSGEQSFAEWSEVPAIVSLDVETRDTKVVGLGTEPVVSADGTAILVRDFAGNVRAIDVAGGNYSTINPPGILGPVVAYLPGGLVLYQSRPSEGQPVQRSPYGSFRAGIQMLPIKVCDLSTREFQTILEAVDPRNQVSFGAKD